ncbi:hypothetical protein SAMN02745911_1397 [Aureimonas altamirensis DSM 21988]|uniref:DUF1178 family protein n=1 Tax=Aureimonas altamirensis DSM 21988 TaxID=1121026 RepID=A0ABY1IDE5_9HYPH|nr:DUF1178 family protein [Aureimonas altamirensis]SHJ01201.1 hypothetical protein SAMN02745911_1397 [Aureimonas altamirensis DSM 21988]
MIRYSLRCTSCSHGFDGWFRSGADFDRQSTGGLLQCPVCDAPRVEKALMAPAVATTPEAAPASMAMGGDRMEAAMARLQELAREVRANSDYVGPKFAEEARRIHFGESEKRGIYGEATADDVRSLLEDGVPALPLPPLPEDRN